MNTVDLTELGWDLACGGFVGREVAVRGVVRTARASGVPAGLLAVLADPGQPEVARLRAFGRVAASLTVAQPLHPVTSDAA